MGADWKSWNSDMWSAGGAEAALTAGGDAFEGAPDGVSTEKSRRSAAGGAGGAATAAGGAGADFIAPVPAFCRGGTALVVVVVAAAAEEDELRPPAVLLGGDLSLSLKERLPLFLPDALESPSVPPPPPPPPEDFLLRSRAQ